MSFLSVFKTIGKDLLAADMFAAPIVSMFNPVAGSAMNLIGQLVTKAEATYTGEKQGTTKRQVVIDEFTAIWPLVQELLKTEGFSLSFDTGQIGTLIDATVAQMNALAVLHDTLKLTKIPTPAA